MAAAVGLLLVRLVQLQVVRADDLGTLAQRQQLATIALEPHRGRLLDRQGRPLAINVESTSIYAVPSLITDRPAFAARIAPALGRSPEEVVRRLAGGRYFVWLARKVPPQTIAQVKVLGLGEQIGFRVEDRRAYPNGTLAAHLLGFVGIDNQGLAGVELAYDRTLRGKAGEAVAAHDGLGRILIETQRTVEAPQDGADLLLTIDQVVQHIAERELDAAMRRTQARRGSVLVMDPRTGELLALALRPAFDPNSGPQARPDLWLNRAIAEVYEPGSTFKIVTAAAALDADLVSSDDIFICEGFLRVGNHTIRDAQGRRHGRVTLGDIIKNSCNVGAAQVATRLGKATFYRYIRAFGFGTPTGVDLPGEVAGLVPPPAAWLGPGLQTIGFGQGVSVTALQLLTAATVLANDGVMVRPHVVRGIRDREGRTTEVIDREVGRRAVGPATASAVRQMLITAVREGSGAQARIAGHEVAGKTGTAQKPSPAGGYDPGRYVASFLGLVPAGDPRLAILVILDEPRGAYFGGEIAAPVFREVAAQTLWYLRIPPQSQFTGSPETRRPAPP